MSQHRCSRIYRGETGESGHFAVRMGDAVVVIARTSGLSAFQLTDRVGMVRPAHCTALGKIILASLRPEQLKRFLERVELKPSTGKTITDIPVLLREIAEIKHSGIAFDDGEFNPEVRCIAVPVMDFTGQIVGALGISAPIWRLSVQAIQSHAKMGAGCGQPSVCRIWRQRCGAALTIIPRRRPQRWRGFRCVDFCSRLGGRENRHVASPAGEVRPAAVLLEPARPHLTAVVEQTLADLAPGRVLPVQLDRVEALDLDGPEAAQAADAEEFARDLRKPALLYGKPRLSGGARVRQQGVPVFVG
jgi:hypothetical protein